MKRILLIADADGGLPPAAKNAVAGETDLDKLSPAPQPAPAAPAPAPKPAATLKDEKWLETEISATEDKLRTLREQKSAPKPAPAAPAAKKKTGWECDDL